MPSSYTGTRENRLALLDKRGQRCDGSNRGCTQAATSEYVVIKANPATGQPMPGETAQTLRGCSKHRRRFGDSAFFKVLAARDIPTRGVSPGERWRGTQRQMRMRALVGCTFIAKPGDDLRTIATVRYVVNDVRLKTTEGEHFMLADVHQVNLPADHDEDDRTAADDDNDPAESQRRVDVPLTVRFSG